jgi:hypothetical protein
MTTSTAQTSADPGALADFVSAQRKAPEQAALPSSGHAGPLEAVVEPEVLPVPAPPAVIIATGVGFAAVPVEGTHAEADLEHLLAGLEYPPDVPSTNASTVGGDSVALAARLGDLEPRLGPVMAGSLSGPGELADLGNRVSSFFAQLRTLEHPRLETASSLGLAPWVGAVAVSVVALELGRRRLRRPAPEGISGGISAAGSTWSRHGGHFPLSTEELP